MHLHHPLSKSEPEAVPYVERIPVILVLGIAAVKSGRVDASVTKRAQPTHERITQSTNDKGSTQGHP